MMEERPGNLTRKSRPVPAPDENVDPVDNMLATKPPQKPAKKKQEIVFSFSTRLSQEAYDLLYKAVEEQDITVREATEQAIFARWK